MLSVLALCLIYVGVCISIYQLYAIYCSRTVQKDELEKPIEESQDLIDLAREADACAQTGHTAEFDRTATRVFGEDFDHRFAWAAFRAGHGLIDIEMLLRRQHRMEQHGDVRIRHLLNVRTRPPRHDIRGPLLSIVVFNTLAVLFLAGLSVFTLGYALPPGPLAWANNAYILLAAICGLIVMTDVLARFDRYMHDLYRIGKLSRHLGHDAA
ncbi:hypothetical protein [Litchfieldella xinjiangensis]|uniref:hypothetical protein n=1 Tax=Litchfieldella xinjiangensis TaxID=1166948 RepID=UPI0005B8E65B|nr:hypothetical protein [Halomonas xinjiangensis]